MDKNKRGKYIGVLGTVVAHVALLALLIFISFTIPQNDDEGGVAVMMGDVESAQEGADNSLVDVDILPEETAAPEPATPEASKEQPIITQESEKTVAINAPKVKTEKTTTKPKVEEKPKQKVEEKPKVVEKSEAEIAAEKKRLAEEKAEAERKAAAEATAKKVAGAFGKGNKMGNSSGTSSSGTGNEGSPDGNSTTGAKSGVGGDGSSYNLGGRSLGKGGLPRPVYNVQEEGTVVVSIVVNPAGKVIDATINSKTNTMSSALRKAAIDAARKATFNEVTTNGNQSGTITYKFKLK